MAYSEFDEWPCRVRSLPAKSPPPRAGPPAAADEHQSGLAEEGGSSPAERLPLNQYAARYRVLTNPDTSATNQNAVARENQTTMRIAWTIQSEVRRTPRVIPKYPANTSLDA